MNSRERFLKALNRECPDRPPVFATLTPQVAKSLSAYMGLSYEEPVDSLLSTRISHTRLLLNMGNDGVGIAAQAPYDKPTITRKDGMLVNEWGMVFKDAGLYNEFAEFPLENACIAEDIESYPFPDPYAEGKYDDALQKIKDYKEEYFIIADLETSIFETSWYLAGLEKILMDLMMQAEYINPLLDQIMDVNIKTGKHLIEMGADMIWAGDDFGTQSTLLMDPQTWRSVFKPRIKYMFEEFRKVNPDIKIAWHSCGSILTIIPDFIEIGLDILNPIQPLASGMNPEFLAAEYGRDLCFFGGIDVQDLLPNGKPDQIRDEVKRRIEILGKNGGYIVAPAHNIQVDTPLENILAFYDAVKNP